MKIVKCLMVLLATLIVVSPVAYAWAVSSPYWKTEPMRIEPGQTKDFALTLQNLVDETPITVKVEWVDNAGVAQFTGPSTTVTVPPGRKDITVPIRVSIPASTPVGSITEISVRFVEVTTGEGGMVAMATGYEKKIPIEVVSVAPESDMPTKEAGMTTTGYALLAIIVIIVLAIIFFGKKKK